MEPVQTNNTAAGSPAYCTPTRSKTTPPPARALTLGSLPPVHDQSGGPAAVSPAVSRGGASNSASPQMGDRGSSAKLANMCASARP